MQNNNISIDLSVLATSLKTIRENTTYLEFDRLLDSLKKANDLGLVDEFIDEMLDLMTVDECVFTSALSIANLEILEK